MHTLAEQKANKNKALGEKLIYFGILLWISPVLILLAAVYFIFGIFESLVKGGK